MTTTKVQESTPTLDLKSLSDEELLVSAKCAAREERRWTERVIEHLFEVERRRLFAKRGYSSLWEYVVNELGYDGGAAQRRIQTMRLSRDLPEVKVSLKEEKVSLTSAAMLQSFFENERRHQKKSYSPEAKRDLLKKIEGLTTREAERTLREISPHALPRERERVLTPTQTEIRFVADAEMMRAITRMKELLSGRHPDPTLEEVFRKALEIAVERLERQKGAGKRGESEPAVKAECLVEAGAVVRQETGRIETGAACTPARGSDASIKREYVALSLRREALKRAEERCTYTDPRTGRRCMARHNLQIEHIRPVSRGGANIAENLTVLCGQHNRLRAEEVLGPWVRQYTRPPTPARK